VAAHGQIRPQPGSPSSPIAIITNAEHLPIAASRNTREASDQVNFHMFPEAGAQQRDGAFN
jgi:hypothetical protein